ncbi:hypothetical protein H696_06321, partial [Fonticula alba]
KYYDFKSVNYDQFHSRSPIGATKLRNLLYCTKPVHDLIRAWDAQRLRLMFAGVKLLSRHDANTQNPSPDNCIYRLTQDAVRLLAPAHLGRTPLPLTFDDTIMLLTNESVLLADLSAQVQRSLVDHPHGGCVFMFTPSPTSCGTVCPMYFSGWRGKSSAIILANKKEKESLVWRVDPENALAHVQNARDNHEELRRTIAAKRKAAANAAAEAPAPATEEDGMPAEQD